MRFAAAFLAALLALPWPLELAIPDWVNRVLYNPRERSQRASEAYAGEEFERAAELADQALAAAPPRRAVSDEEGATVEPPPDPRLAFNAGTAHLAAGDEKRAVELLEGAVEAIDAGEAADLDAAARYNLGNARLAVDDAAGAVEAFKQTLRRDPADADAKHNLELALKRLEEQRKLPFQPPQESPEGEQQGEQEEGESQGSDSPAEQPNDADASDPGEGEQRPGDEEQPPSEQPQGDQPQQDGERPLPNFEEQPDMSAEQAAALLEAVENLERRQRQQEAAERARRRDRGGKDW